MTDTRKTMQQALEALIESARLLGATEAKRGFGVYTQDDSRFESAMYEAIHKHKQAALAQQGEPVAWLVTTEKQDGTRETYPITGRYKDVQDVCDFGEPIPLYAGAAPAAQQGADK